MTRWIAILAFAATIASAHERLKTSGGTPIYRPDALNVQFVVDSEFVAGARSTDGRVMITANSDVQGALRQAVIPWSNVRGSYLRFATPGTTSAGRNTSDRLNTFVLRDTPELRSAVGSALGICLSRFNAADGAIADSDIVFNPNLPGGVAFSTNLAANTYDLLSVAIHELGHAIGLRHFVFLGAPMVPFNGLGVRSATLSSDEEAVVNTAYPLPPTPLLLGSISGSVQFQSGGPVRGAVVNAVDPATGVAVGVIASRVDGTYTITGVPPGRYLVYAEPLSGRVGPGDVGAPASEVDTAFQPRFFGGNATPPQIDVAAGVSTRADLTVTAGAATISAPTLGRFDAASNTFIFGRFAELVPAGGSADLQIFGPGIDATVAQNGIRLLAPGLSIRTGTLRMDPANVVNGFPALRFTVDAAQRTTRLMSTIVLTKGAEIAVISGGLVVTVPDAPLTLTSRLDVVHAASLALASLAPDSFVTLFGSNLATGLVVATTSPFPTELGGSRVLIRDRAGVERPAGLVFVAPGQMNLLVPDGTATGLATLRVVTATGEQSVPVLIETLSPGLFTANADGRGAPAALFLRVNADGSRSDGFLFEDSAGRAPRPIDLGSEGDQVYLSFYGTGIRGLTGPATMTIGGTQVPVLGAGAQGQFAGLDQVNVGPLPQSLAGRGEVDAVLTIDGKVTNVVRLAFR